MKTLGIILFGMYMFSSWSYFLMYMTGSELVVRYAKGMLYVMMMGGPVLTLAGLALVGAKMLGIVPSPQRRGPAGENWPWK